LSFYNEINVFTVVTLQYFYYFRPTQNFYNFIRTIFRALGIIPCHSSSSMYRRGYFALAESLGRVAGPSPRVPKRLHMYVHNYTVQNKPFRYFQQHGTPLGTTLSAELLLCLPRIEQINELIT
jgi:hypothetical protein